MLTVLIRYCTLDLAKGPMNSSPGRFEAMQVRHLVAAFRAVGFEFLVDASTEITLLKDGRTFRADRLPPDAGPIRAAASSEISFSVEDPGAHADSGAFEARLCSNDGEPGTAHSPPVATTDREARRAALRAMISPEAQRRRQLQDEAYDRDIARILGRAA